jgi:hypothetical protein
MRKLTMALLAVGALAGATDAYAQASTTANATVVIPQVLAFGTVDDLTIDATQFDFSATDTDVGAGTANVQSRANVTHSLSVSGANLTNGTDALTLQVLSSGAVFTDVTGTATEVAAGLARGLQNTLVSYQATADILLHSPGTYTGILTYTIVASP